MENPATPLHRSHQDVERTQNLNAVFSFPFWSELPEGRRWSILQRLRDVNQKPVTLKAPHELLGPNNDLRSPLAFPESKPALPFISPAAGVGTAVMTGVVTDSTRVAGSPIPAHLVCKTDATKGPKWDAEVRSSSRGMTVPSLSACPSPSFSIDRRSFSSSSVGPACRVFCSAAVLRVEVKRGYL